MREAMEKKRYGDYGNYEWRQPDNFYKKQNTRGM